MKVALRIGLVAPALLLTACQIAVPQPAPPPRMLPDDGVSVSGVTVRPSAADNASTTPTYTIKRDTLRESVGLSGKVVPRRSAQLTFKGNGTVTAVNAASGQHVTEGEVLAELALDDDSLQAARAQATLADLTYQTEQAKLDQMQSPANNESVQQLRVAIERDQADIQRLEQDQAAVQAKNDRSEKALSAGQGAADRKVAQAEQALQSARDGVSKAQADVKRAQEDAQSAQQQASAEATAAATAASAAVRVAARQLDDANARLEQAKMGWATTSAGQQIETQQLRVDQGKEALTDARAAADAASTQSPSTDHTARQIAAEAASANANVKAAQRTLATDSLELKHLLTNLESAKAKDAAEVKAATYAVEAAKEQLASLQLAEQQAQQKAQALAKQVTASSQSRASQQSIDAAQAAVKQAEANVRTAELNVDDAVAAQAAAGDAIDPPAQFADRSLSAARAQLNADQARLAALQGTNSAAELARQQTRVSLLRDQATGAAAAAQPVVALRAPFDATVAEIGVSPGQRLAPGAPSVDGASSDGRTQAIRLVGAGASILADVSESDVARFNPGQRMELSFPGLPGQTASGTIVEVGALATTKDNQTTYPVRIEITTPPATVKFGMSAQAGMSVAEARDVLAAPRRAVRTSGGQTIVDKLDASGQVHATPVQIGRSFGASVELLDGVQEGDVVAVYDAPITRTPAFSSSPPTR